MKLEYLVDITGGEKYPYADPDKLIRLYDFDQSETQKLIDNIQLEVINRNSDLELSTHKFIEPLNCNLKFTVSTIDYESMLPPVKISYVNLPSKAIMK